MIRVAVVMCVLARLAHAQEATAVVGGGVEVQPALPVHIEYGMDGGFGMTRGDQPLSGYAGLFALPVNLFVNEWLAFGVRGQLTFSQDPAVDDPAVMGRADASETPNYLALSIAAGPRFRLYDPDQRDDSFSHRIGWVLDLDGGYLYFADNARSRGPLARATVGRQVLMVNSDGNGVNSGVAVSVESGFGPASGHRAVLASWWFHGEGGARPGSSVKPPPQDNLWPAAFAVDIPALLGTNFGSVDANLVAGISAAYSVGVSDLVAPIVRVDTMYLRHSDTDGTKMVGASAGLQFRFNEWGPLSVEVLGGYERAYGIEPHAIGDGAFIDVGTGFHLVDCMIGADIGTRLRIGIGDDNSHLAAIALILGGARGNEPGALGYSKCGATAEQTRGPRRAPAVDPETL